MRLSINETRRLCRAAGARQVVIVAFDGSGKYAVTSYGETRAECSAVRPLCDQIADRLGDGSLEAPAVRGPEIERGNEHLSRSPWGLR